KAELILNKSAFYFIGMKFIFRFIVLILSKSSILVGGQAVIEGVMMRVPGAYSTAVRDPNGDIQLDRHEFISLTEKYKYLKLPFIRGIISLFEAMKIGIQTLTWSAEIALPESEKQKDRNKLLESGSSALALILAVSLFFIAPLGITSWLFDKNNEPFLFNILSGTVRISIFLVYLLAISMMKDVKRLFQYHGAEHKTVYTFENGSPLNVESARDFPTQHPRCGTSFIFIIMIVAILFFAVIDSVAIPFLGDLTLLKRLALHLPLIPFVAGVGYEVLKITAKHRKNPIFRAFSQPGIWLQNITTKQPDDKQLEVAITSLKSAFGDKIHHFEGREFEAEAIG
ncbi:MAG: DUF1385 domain-containing protein, partial [Fidelibacterota bacterium]